ncbi:GNAT family N-acetyltransferase [Agromyces sp. H66]|uniref:GNAT family N-acetyltransferase n=1 Tax=Agromyces sp. H66 TaxID=2529859 RepID=UPI0010AA8170|nr:GNAT family N-acetyltransferase [Agromyces sp. H66]
MPTAVTDETHPTDLRILPANEVPFADVAAVFGTKGDPAHCWCQWFKIPGRDWRSVGDDGLRDRLEAQLAASDSGPGLLAYDGETPAGWCAVEPRPGLVRLARSRIVAGGTAHPDFTDRDIWAVTCFVVPRAHRKRGIGTALAEAAVTYARERGARIIEGYAVDASPHEKHAAADLFHGTVSMFEAAGFTEVARPTRDRVVMERRLHG